MTTTADRFSFNLYTKNKLQLCSPYSATFMDSCKDRFDVHTQGDFHVGIQVYLFTVDQSGKVQLLVTQRSEHVDISRGTYDQIAIQMIEDDECNVEKAIHRGLKEELGIDSQYLNVMSVDNLNVKIVKKYIEDSDLYNREYIKLAFAYIDHKNISMVTARSKKICDCQWWDFDTYKKRIFSNPRNFTKTSKFYVFSSPLLNLTEEFIDLLARKKAEALKEPIRHYSQYSRIEFYEYGDGPSLLIEEGRTTNFLTLSIYDGSNNILHLENLVSVDVEDSKHADALTCHGLDSNHEYHWNGTRLSTSPIRNSSGTGKTNPSEDIASGIINFKKSWQLSIQTAKRAALSRKLYLWLLDSGYAIYDSLFKLWRHSKSCPRNAASNTTHIYGLLGSFDPVHYEHIRLVADAMASNLRERSDGDLAVGYLIPIGDSAPGPDGSIWKSGKNCIHDRLAFCQSAVKPLQPMINVSNLSVDHPDSSGFELCLKLIEMHGRESTVHFHLIMGSDSWNCWHKALIAFTRTLSKNAKGHYLLDNCQTEFKMSVIVRENNHDKLADVRSHPFHSLTLLNHVTPTVRSSHIRSNHLCYAPVASF